MLKERKEYIYVYIYIHTYNCAKQKWLRNKTILADCRCLKKSNLRHKFSQVGNDCFCVYVIKLLLVRRTYRIVHAKKHKCAGPPLWWPPRCEASLCNPVTSVPCILFFPKFQGSSYALRAHRVIGVILIVISLNISWSRNIKEYEDIA